MCASPYAGNACQFTSCAAVEPSSYGERQVRGALASNTSYRSPISHRSTSAVYRIVPMETAACFAQDTAAAFP